MEKIKFDAFNPAPFENHVPLDTIAKNKKSMNLLLGVMASVAIGFVIYKLNEYYNEERNDE